MKDNRLPGEIRGLLLPVGSHCLLLPSITVAEVLSFQEPTPIPESPDWLLGRIDWRGYAPPLLAWERLILQQEPDWSARRLRMAVLNTLNGNPRLPYIALLSTGVARLIRISADNLVADPTDLLDSPLLQASVLIAGQPAWIPNLDVLEQRLLTCNYV